MSRGVRIVLVLLGIGAMIMSALRIDAAIHASDLKNYFLACCGTWYGGIVVLENLWELSKNESSTPK